MARTKAAPFGLKRATMDEDRVVKGILKAISLKRIRPGTKLGEDQLAEVFGTNRMHIRQVLAYLGSRNVVTLYPNRGAYVAQPSAEEARQVFETRRVLESAALSTLIARLGEAEVAQIRQHVARETFSDHADRWETLSVTGDFHSLIGRLAGNAVLSKFLDEIVLRTSLIIAAFEAPGSRDCSYDAHPVIADHIIARDEAAAVAAMDRHLGEMQQRLRLSSLSAEPNDIAAIFSGLGITRRARRSG
jgi:DNA-binding GntR family transcriptional regulator